MIATQELNRQQYIEERTPSFQFSSTAEVIQALRDKAEYKPNNLYPRDGNFQLSKLEEHSAELVGVHKGKAIWFNSGMAAVIACAELAAPTSGDTVIHGVQSYSQTADYITSELVDRGVKNFAVDPGNISDIEKAIAKHKPKVVLFETVVNGTEMAVLDVERFLDLPILREVNPLIILDNTLPTNSNLQLASTMERHLELKTIGVESGTKFYALNQELGGIAFTQNDLLLEKLLKFRRRHGKTLGPSAIKKISETIPPSKEQFDRDNTTIARNTLKLAQACSAAENVNGKFVVSHPNLTNHPNSEYVNSMCPEGITPVFFIIPIDPELSHIVIADTIWEKVLKGRGHYAQSFGFGRTGLTFDTNTAYVRIAGGMETPEEIAELTKDLQDVLSNL